MKKKGNFIKELTKYRHTQIDSFKEHTGYRHTQIDSQTQTAIDRDRQGRREMSA